MTRRSTVALGATAALGLSVVAIGSAGAAAKKNQIEIKGGAVFVPGVRAADNQHFTPRKLTVKSGTLVTLRNRTKTDPHSISFVKKAFLPKSFDAAAAGPLGIAHGENDTGPPTAIKVDNGVAAADQNAPLNVDTLGDDKTAGDSQFIGPGEKRITFKVTAKKGAKLYYFCIIHPWMQGQINVK
jgi:plastocyanin